MPRKAVAPTDYQRGLKYLNAAKRVIVIAGTLDDAEAAILRKAADGLTVRGLALVVQGAREIESAMRTGRVDATQQ